MKIKTVGTLVVLVICSVFLLAGCESLGKKFTRKRPQQVGPAQGMVLQPAEYGQESREDRYAKSFLYWKSWHSEFIDALQGTNHKRQIETLDEALKNLVDLRGLVDEGRAAKLDARIKRMEQLRARVADDIYFSRRAENIDEAETLWRGIMADLKDRQHPAQ